MSNFWLSIKFLSFILTCGYGSYEEMIQKIIIMNLWLFLAGKPPCFLFQMFIVVANKKRLILFQTLMKTQKNFSFCLKLKIAYMVIKFNICAKNSCYFILVVLCKIFESIMILHLSYASLVTVWNFLFLELPPEDGKSFLTIITMVNNFPPSPFPCQLCMGWCLSLFLWPQATHLVMPWKLRQGVSPLAPTYVQFSHSIVAYQVPEKKVVGTIFRVFGTTW